MSKRIPVQRRFAKKNQFIQSNTFFLSFHNSFQGLSKGILM